MDLKGYLTRRIKYFTKGEIILWSCSVFCIVLSFLITGGNGNLNLVTSLIGVTALIFIAKGNPIGQVLTVLFSILYGIIAYFCSYYGEMITYLGMTAPMAVIALVAWMRNPYNGNISEVKVNHLKRQEIGLSMLLAVVVSCLFYFILKYFHTANLLPSTLSVTTSFLAVYLTFRRSACYALAYALNDIVLIVLWGMASQTDLSYVSVTVCFAMFLANDIYGFVNWSAMQKRQSAESQKKEGIKT